MTWDTVGGIGHDARIAVRLWARRPGLAAVALITIALGIGAPTAMFSVVHAVLIEPLPFREPDRIVTFRLESRTRRGAMAFDAVPASAALDWAVATTTLQGLSLYNDRALTLSTADGPFRLSGTAVMPNTFRVLGVAAMVGRTFDEDGSDTHQIVLSHATWQRFFGGRADMAGAPITLDGQRYLVTGVMPEDFDFPTNESAFWVPLSIDSGGSRGMLLPAIARLNDTATVAAVEDEAGRHFGDGDSSFVVHARTLHDQLVGGNRRLLWILMGAVGFVSIIATTNIALILLVRGAARAREFSIRLATGAPRGRILRQLVVEAATLSLVGGVVGVALAAVLLGTLLEFVPADMPRLQHASLNSTVLLFAVVLTAITSVVFGILSAGRAVTVDMVRALGTGSGESALHRITAPRRHLNTLAGAEMVLTLVLLVGAALLLRSFLALVRIDHGFNPSGALALQVSLPAARYPTPAERYAFAQRLHDRLKQLPDAGAVGLAVTMPNRQPSARFAYDATSLPVVEDPATLQVAEVRTVSEGFVEAMGMRLLRGRTFEASDTDGAEPVMIINERLARVHFGEADPVGRLLFSGSGTRRVIGVVDDVRPAARGTEPGPSAFLPMRQDEGIFRWFGTLNVVIRTSRPERAIANVRGVVLSLDAEMPPFNVRTLEQDVARLVAGPRFSATALVAFGAIALVLAAVGLFGVVSYVSLQRTRELAVRIALGATRGRVLWLAMSDGVLIVCSGLALGLLAAWWLAQTLAGLLYAIDPVDGVSMAAVAGLLAMIGLLAVLVPALKATRVSVLDALRAD